MAIDEKDVQEIKDMLEGLLGDRGEIYVRFCEKIDGMISRIDHISEMIGRKLETTRFPVEITEKQKQMYREMIAFPNNTFGTDDVAKIMRKKYGHLLKDN